jgi:hypothetical protein
MLNQQAIITHINSSLPQLMHSFIQHSDPKGKSQQSCHLRVSLEVIKSHLRCHTELAKILDTSRSKLQWIHTTTLSQWLAYSVKFADTNDLLPRHMRLFLSTLGRA